MNEFKQAMIRVVPIMIFLLILSYRQAPAEQMVNRDQKTRFIIRENSTSYETQELGYLSDVDQNNLRELPPVFRAFQNEISNLTGVFIPILFRFSHIIRSNPLLTDRPPPKNGKQASKLHMWISPGEQTS